MPEVEIEIGGRRFEIACEEGEEPYLQAAAALLDTEARSVLEQVGRLPQDRMLLMAGLLLADRFAGLEDELKAARARIEVLERELTQLRSAPPEPQRIEVPVVPHSVRDMLAELAARAESLAAEAEELAAAGSETGIGADQGTGASGSGAEADTPDPAGSAPQGDG